ncbi:acyl-CoA N-acyltransferase [Scenedesmus sp. NREL 46B-D3]|nr:acyl-CoA N-acyltransferase [Scenedesmus sp. NREL 46B-D3]
MTARAAGCAAPAAAAVLGYIIVQVNSVTAHINKLAVAPHARRRGLGAALLRAALQVAIHERRALCSTLHVDASNAPAVALYCAAGFERDGTIADYYGPGKPALKLLADLRESSAVAAFVAAVLVGLLGQRRNWQLGCDCGAEESVHSLLAAELA